MCTCRRDRQPQRLFIELQYTSSLARPTRDAAGQIERKDRVAVTGQIGLQDGNGKSHDQKC